MLLSYPKTSLVTILLLLSTDPPSTTFTAHGHVFMAPTAEGTLKTSRLIVLKQLVPPHYFPVYNIFISIKLIKYFLLALLQKKHPKN